MNLHIDNFDFDFFKSFYPRFKQLNKNKVFNILKNKKNIYQIWSYEDSFLFKTYSWHDYINFYNDLKNTNTINNAFLHYISNGHKENRIIIKKTFYNSNFIDWELFDWSFYVDFYNLKENSQKYAKEHYMKIGVIENKLFSYEHSFYYYNYNWQEVKRNNTHFFNSSLKNIVEYYFKYNHIFEFKELNLKKNILDINSFHWKFYVNFYDDLYVLKNYKDALLHYKNKGFKENRFFSIYHNYLYLNYDWEKYNLDYQLDKEKKESFIYYLNHGINENHSIYKILNENTFYHPFFIYFNSINSDNINNSINIYLKNKSNNKYLYSYQHYLIYLLFDWTKIYNQYKNNNECYNINNSNDYLIYYLDNYKNLNHRLILKKYSNFKFLLENKNIYLFLNDINLLKDIIQNNIKYNDFYFLYYINEFSTQINKTFINIDLIYKPINFEFILNKSQKEDITFSIIIFSNGNENNIYNSLLSIFYQNYKNWEIYFINNSLNNSNTFNIFNKIIQDYSIKNKIYYFENNSNLNNINYAFNIYQNIDNDNVIIKLNEDWLSSSDVLNTLYDIFKNNVYKIIFSSHKLYFNQEINNINKMIKYPQIIQTNILFRSYPDFYFKHFYVGYAFYFKNIPKEYLTYENEWLDIESKMAEIFCLIELANGQIFCIDEPLFIYDQLKNIRNNIITINPKYNFNNIKIIDYIKSLNNLQKI